MLVLMLRLQLLMLMLIQLVYSNSTRSNSLEEFHEICSASPRRNGQAILGSLSRLPVGYPDSASTPHPGRTGGSRLRAHHPATPRNGRKVIQLIARLLGYQLMLGTWGFHNAGSSTHDP